MKITKQYLEEANMFDHNIKLFDKKGRVFIGYLEKPIGLSPSDSIRVLLKEKDKIFKFQLNNIDWIEKIY